MKYVCSACGYVYDPDIGLNSDCLPVIST
ncbi:MAG: rubredoxin [Desulfobulbaceae bacterium]|nr:rubredoxin [Desulfobulbaceae bacterium]